MEEIVAGCLLALWKLVKFTEEARSLPHPVPSPGRSGLNCFVFWEGAGVEVRDTLFFLTDSTAEPIAGEWIDVDGVFV